MVALTTNKMAAKDGGRNAFVFHLFCLLVNLAGCCYDFFYVELSSYVIYGGRLKFLTHWSQYVHTLFFAFATAINFNNRYLIPASGLAPDTASSLGKDAEESALVRLRDSVFVAVCFPLGIMVCLLFWGITLVEPGGIMTSENARMVPLYGIYNQYLHTFPLLLDLAALYLVSHIYPRRRKGVLCVVLIALSYLVWLVHIGNHTGYWCYGFLQHQTRFEFSVFVLATMLATTAVYIIGEKISAFVWRGAFRKSI